MANITRKEIANHLLRIGVELDPVLAIGYVNQIIDILKEKIRDGEYILISNFGRFSIRQKRARKGRNPRTGEEVIITPRRVVTFHPSPAFRARLNKDE
ncbi:MAG: HU family DNA-binding protein [Myxococcota bacterium]